MPTLADDLRYLIDRDHQTARPLLHDLVARLPNSVEARRLLGESYQRSFDAAHALEHYRAAHLLEPENLLFRERMGLCTTEMGDYEAALAIYRDAISLAPTEVSGSMTALLLHRLGRIEESLMAYAQSLADMKRDHVEAPYMLRAMAMLLRDAGAPLAAERFMNEAIQLYVRNPTHVAYYFVMCDNSVCFHEWIRFAHKSELARALARRRGKPGAPRYPESFVLPEDRAALLDYAARESGASYIAKPPRGSGGQGISVTRDVHALADRMDVVVQRYIERPYLVDGRKAHVRLYGLVTSVAPLRAYLYREGIVRFAPDLYDLSDAGLANVHAHVTNTALHLDHPTLEVSEDPAQENVGHVWTLGAYLKRMKADGRDIRAVRRGLRELGKGFVDMLCADGLFERQARAAPRRAFGFKMFVLDVLIDADARPWLIEMQHMPALRGSPLVERVNAALLKTIFEMSCGYAFDDAMPADKIGAVAKDGSALAQREAEHEFANRGLFEPLTRAGVTGSARSSR
jgi:tetratricopeptide (TPR) repeat protein